MNSRERILAAKYGYETDRIPVDAWWSEELYEKLVSLNNEKPESYYQLDTRRFFTEMPLLKNNWQKFLANENDFIDIYQYPFPGRDFSETSLENLGQKILDIKKEGFPAIGHIGSVCFEVANNIMGMEKFLLSIYDNFEIIDDICWEITNIKCKIALEFARRGADIIHMGDDFGSQKGLLISPVIWKKLFFNKIEKIISEVKHMGKDCLIFFHSDGDISEIIEHFIDAGVDFLNPIQPECMDIYSIGNKYSDKISFWGGIGTQSTLYGSKEDIFRKVREAIEILRKKKKFVISPTHMLQNNIPVKNIDYFFNAVNYYGRFK